MKCPVCNGLCFIEYCKVQTYSILKCEKCGVGVTAPFPTKEQLIEFNRKTYDVEQRIQIYLSRQDYFKKRYEGYIKNIKATKKDGKLLDIGCNIGLFMKVAQQAGFDVKGVELNAGCALYGKEKFHLDIDSKYLEDIAFPDETFDVITLFDVLEHIPDMNGFIDELRRVLKKDGLVVIQAPNLNSLMTKLTKSEWCWLSPPDHLYHFTPDSMTRFLQAHGFRIKKIKTWEPAGDFSNNIIAVCPINGPVGKALQKLLRRTRIVFVLTLLLQKIWWQKKKGGLIEVYAIKT